MSFSVISGVVRDSMHLAYSKVNSGYLSKPHSKATFPRHSFSPCWQRMLTGSSEMILPFPKGMMDKSIMGLKSGAFMIESSRVVMSLLQAGQRLSM